MIPEGMMIDLYAGDNGTGEKRTFVGAEYLDSNQRMFCQNVLDTEFKVKV